MRMDASELPRSEIVRHVIEYSVQSAHRHVFGVFAWYSLLAALGLGPAGAVIYRVSELVAALCEPARATHQHSHQRRRFNTRPRRPGTGWIGCPRA